MLTEPEINYFYVYTNFNSPTCMLLFLTSVLWKSINVYPRWCIIERSSYRNAGTLPYSRNDSTDCLLTYYIRYALVPDSSFSCEEVRWE